MWMFYSKTTNKRINHLHERAFWLIYDGYELTFQKLLEKDVSFTIHHYNIQALCTELYKAYHTTPITNYFQRTVYPKQHFL